MKNFKSFISVALALLLTLAWNPQPGFASIPNPITKDPEAQKVYNWFTKVQFPSGLVATREGKEGFCFVYDQALAIYVFLLFNDTERAKQVLDFFNAAYEKQLEKGHFIGFVDMYFSTGAEGATYRAGGPNAWLLNAINEYTYQTGKTTYLELGEALADWLIDLQAIDGGMMGGHHPHLHFISTEHNADAYAALKNFYLLNPKPIYAEKAEEFKNWLLEVAYIPSEKRFGNGKDDINYALDTSSWTVLSLGKEVEEVLKTAEEVAKNTQYYEFKQCNVEGFDFGGPYWDTPFPDKDAVWFEGTAQMILAYKAVGKDNKALKYMNEMQKCLTPSSFHPETHGLPYASNAGTPAYGGWQMTNTPLCVSSNAWFLFAKSGYNPFNLGGTLLHDQERFPWPPKNIHPVSYVKKQFVPIVDDFETTRAKIVSSYPERLIQRQNCIFNLSVEYNLVREGRQGLRLLFIPKNISGVRGEFVNKEIYNFDDIPNDPLILTTSAQPETIIEEDEEAVDKGLESKRKKSKAVSATNNDSIAIVTRKFLTPQNWKQANVLTFYLKHDHSTNQFFIRLRDNSGHEFVSEPIELEGKGWKQHAISLKNSELALDHITEISFGLRSGSPIMESTVYLDQLSLD